MSVVFLGVFVAQVVEPALLGFVLLLSGVLSTDFSRRSQPGSILNLNLLATRCFVVLERLLSVFPIPTTPRAPPIGRFATMQPIPVSTEAYRRLTRLSELP